MTELFVLALLALATHRITRFITRDKHPAMAIPRKKFTDRWSIYDEAPPGVKINPKVSVTGKPTNLFMRSAAYLWECDWCMAIIVGGILTLITARMASVPLPWLMWFAVASVAALIAERESS